MLSHVHVGVNEFERAWAFYEAVLPTLGWVPRFVDRTRPWAAWQWGDRDRPLIVIGVPFDGAPARAGNGQMVAFLAPSREAVRVFHRLALSHGARDEGAPGLRPDYHPDYYGAYVRDPEGNKLCVCCHEAE